MQDHNSMQNYNKIDRAMPLEAGNRVRRAGCSCTALKGAKANDMLIDMNQYGQFQESGSNNNEYK